MKTMRHTQNATATLYQLQTDENLFELYKRLPSVLQDMFKNLTFV